jgi:hypothetical protein
MVSEFEQVEFADFATPDEQAFEKKWVKSLENEFMVGQFLLPNGTRRLSSGNGGRSVDDQKPVRVKVGIPWTPEEFVAQARRCRHPFDDAAVVPPALARAVSRNAESCAEDVIRWRTAQLSKYRLIAEELNWCPAWSDPRAARWMKFSDDQALMPVQLADERRSVQAFAGCIVLCVAASLVLSATLPLAAASSARLCRCLMAAALLRQAVSMPHGRRPFGACCVVAFGRSRFGARRLLLRARSEPKDIANKRSHAFKCPCLSLPAKVGVPAEMRKILGCHTSSAGEAVQCYAGVEFAEPLRSLDGVLKMIRDGAFFS